MKMGAFYSLQSQAFATVMLLLGLTATITAVWGYISHGRHIQCEGYGRKPSDEAICKRCVKAARITIAAIALLGGLAFLASIGISMLLVASSSLPSLPFM